MTSESTMDPVSVPVKKSTIREQLGPDALGSVVRVSRQPPDGPVPNDGGQEIPLRLLSGFHTRRKSGGWGEKTYYPYLYAYGNCQELPVGHYGVHGPCPHSILACIYGAERDDVWRTLCDLTGFVPPSGSERVDEREEMKNKILHELDADEPAKASPSPFHGDIGPKVNGWSVADVLFDADRRRGLLEYWIDHERGVLVQGLGDGLSAELEEAFEKNPDRFEKVPDLGGLGSSVDVDRCQRLLTDGDMADVAIFFLRSLGLEPESLSLDSGLEDQT